MSQDLRNLWVPRLVSGALSFGPHCSRQAPEFLQSLFPGVQNKSKTVVNSTLSMRIRGPKVALRGLLGYPSARTGTQVPAACGLVSYLCARQQPASLLSIFDILAPHGPREIANNCAGCYGGELAHEAPSAPSLSNPAPTLFPQEWFARENVDYNRRFCSQRLAGSLETPTGSYGSSTPVTDQKMRNRQERRALLRSCACW